MENKYASVHYSQYLQLDKITGAQHLRSVELGAPAHDEMLFIIIHQVYELWFKQVVHELSSVTSMFKNENVDERNIAIAVSRLNRVVEIQKILIDQVRVLETMTPLDFLDFRNFLIPASGFQSLQFRQVEILLGLKNKDRVMYNRKEFSSAFPEKEQQQLREMDEGKSLADLVEQWLERTPFLEFEGFNFTDKYRDAVRRMNEKEKRAILATTHIGEEEKQMRLKMLSDSELYTMTALEENQYRKSTPGSESKMSFKSTIAALLINLYRDEPILRMPFEMLGKLVDIDELFTTWRYRHAQMVLRMLGKKMGTGGSSGHDYLKKTAEKHHVFRELHTISTLLIPRSELPELPEGLKKELGFYFTSLKK